MVFLYCNNGSKMFTLLSLHIVTLFCSIAIKSSFDKVHLVESSSGPGFTLTTTDIGRIPFKKDGHDVGLFSCLIKCNFFYRNTNVQLFPSQTNQYFGSLDFIGRSIPYHA